MASAKVSCVPGDIKVLRLRSYVMFIHWSIADNEKPLGVGAVTVG